MNVIYSMKDYVSNVFHQDSGSGASDVVIVQQSDGLLHCSPFHVHFGSLHKLKQIGEQQVTLEVNGHVVDGVRMKMDAAGEVHFVHPVDEPVDKQECSTLPSPSSSIGDTSVSPMQNDFFVTKDNALEPQDEENAARYGQRQWTQGLGTLPIVDEVTASEDEDLPTMVKCASVYFDAVDIEATMAADENHFANHDHPSMSLCGHLLDEAETKQDVHRIFFEHIVTFDFFRANSASILANPKLRFLVDGNVTSYDTDTQAYLVSRVLFPYSHHLSVGTSPSGNGDKTDVSMKSQTSDAKSGVMTRNENIENAVYSFSSSALGLGPATLERLDEGCSDDAGSTQDTASITSEYYLKKSLKPTQEELLEMGLCAGANDIAFVLRSYGVGEVARVTANLFLWPVTTKIVIVQIDGAILSSGTTGRMFKRKDPAAMHPGAVDFYSKLARNGYRVVYVTCHGIFQANLHQILLHNSAGDDGDITLPMGPVLLSPDRLLASGSSEITDTQVFKISVLDGLRSLFPRCVNPFYAAFGITEADSAVFMQVGVFIGKVFIVNPADGSLRHHFLMGFHESYTSLLDRMDAMFPLIYSQTTQVPSSSQGSAQLVVRTLQSVPRNLSTTAYLVKDEAQFAFEAVASSVRTRSLTDEAYNDINFWRLKPGHV
ncbi:unnamed protein product [Peronospora destructor]|uniref:LNS2/PITP domain-containing protein n=1 Tax=Peronospora destructor TaxID=86335 RepID=A0AAV0V3Y1_9STRA|nr:unnamed protein product [Peronospora destructor]